MPNQPKIELFPTSCLRLLLYFYQMFVNHIEGELESIRSEVQKLSEISASEVVRGRHDFSRKFAT